MADDPTHDWVLDQVEALDTSIRTARGTMCGLSCETYDRIVEMLHTADESGRRALAGLIKEVRVLIDPGAIVDAIN